VEKVKYFLLPLPAPHKVSHFWVYFRFQLLSSKCFRFYKNLTAFTASAYHISAPCFIKSISTSGSLKCKMLPSSLPFPASFFKVFPLPQIFIRFRFHNPPPCLMKNAFSSGSSKSKMLPSSLPASFFKVLPLPQKSKSLLFIGTYTMSITIKLSVQ